ncbi:MAG TPA: hypothetical protein VMU51_09075 [Mycobacteriales bacterium]|nr:hypothetical protein [Mycobacteriales bacterium]
MVTLDERAAVIRLLDRAGSGVGPDEIDAAARLGWPARWTGRCPRPARTGARRPRPCGRSARYRRDRGPGRTAGRTPAPSARSGSSWSAGGSAGWCGPTRAGPSGARRAGTGDLKVTTDFRDVYATRPEKVLDTGPGTVLPGHRGRAAFR